MLPYHNHVTLTFITNHRTSYNTQINIIHKQNLKIPHYPLYTPISIFHIMKYSKRLQIKHVFLSYRHFSSKATLIITSISFSSLIRTELMFIRYFNHTQYQQYKQHTFSQRCLSPKVQNRPQTSTTHHFSPFCCIPITTLYS